MANNYFPKPFPTGFVPLTVTCFGNYCYKSIQSRLDRKYALNVCRSRRSFAAWSKPYQVCCCQSDVVDISVELKQLLQKTPIYLIGMMGSGKSTVGQHLATKLSYSFLDTDQLIESVEDKKISEIFQQQGEDKFREIESDILIRIQPCLGYVIATGGGIVLKSSNWTLLRNGIVVFLDVSIPTIMKRLVNDTSRPLLQGTEPQKRLEEIRRKRLPLYQKADIYIHLTDSRIEQEFTQEQWTDLITQRLLEFLTTRSTSGTL